MYEDALERYPHLVTATKLVENKVYRLFSGYNIIVWPDDGNEHITTSGFSLREGSSEFLVLKKATQPYVGALFRTKLIGIAEPFLGYMFSGDYELFEEVTDNDNQEPKK